MPVSHGNEPHYHWLTWYTTNLSNTLETIAMVRPFINGNQGRGEKNRNEEGSLLTSAHLCCPAHRHSA